MSISKRKPPTGRRSQSPRTSVTFPPDLYETLERLAKRKKVSVAWVVREAAERYVDEQSPLFAKVQP
jgi:predicted DNA-binding protein